MMTYLKIKTDTKQVTSIRRVPSIFFPILDASKRKKTNMNKYLIDHVTNIK